MFVYLQFNTCLGYPSLNLMLSPFSDIQLFNFISLTDFSALQCLFEDFTHTHTYINFQLKFSFCSFLTFLYVLDPIYSILFKVLIYLLQQLCHLRFIFYWKIFFSFFLNLAMFSFLPIWLDFNWIVNSLNNML